MMTWRESVAPLADRGFRFYFLSRAVDLFGDFMGSVALAFAVLAVSDSPGALGAVLAAHSVPMVAFLLLGGVLADRLGLTLVIQVSNVVAGSSHLAIAVLVLTGVAEVWHLVLLAAVNGVAAAANGPALASLLPQLAPREQLQQANALTSLLRNLCMVLGPATSGAVVAFAGAGWAVGVNAVTYFVAAALLLPVALPPKDRATPAGGMVADLREGWRYFRTTTWLWAVVLAFAVLNAIHAGALNTLGPVLAADSEIGETGWGLIRSAEGVGTVLMAVVLMRVRLRRPLLTGMAGCTLFGLPMLALGLTTQPGVVLAAAFVGGVGIEVFGIGWNIAMQEQVPKEMLSRAYSYDMLGSFVAIPVGQLAFGPAGAVFGVQRVLLVAGAAYVVICAATLLSRDVRRLDRVP